MLRICGCSLPVSNIILSLLMPSLTATGNHLNPIARRSCSVFKRLSHVGMRERLQAHHSPTVLRTGLWSAWSVRRLQLVGQGGQHLVKLGVPQGLSLISSPAPPQQPHLEISQEELQDLCLLLETCNIIITSPYQCINSKQK